MGPNPFWERNPHPINKPIHMLTHKHRCGRSFCSHFLRREQEMSFFHHVALTLFSLLKTYSFPNKHYCYFHWGKKKKKNHRCRGRRGIGEWPRIHVGTNCEARETPRVYSKIKSTPTPNPGESNLSAMLQSETWASELWSALQSLPSFSNCREHPYARNSINTSNQL
jgi:hypothetical protein